MDGWMVPWALARRTAPIKASKIGGPWKVHGNSSRNLQGRGMFMFMQVGYSLAAPVDSRWSCIPIPPAWPTGDITQQWKRIGRLDPGVKRTNWLVSFFFAWRRLRLHAVLNFRQGHKQHFVPSSGSLPTKVVRKAATVAKNTSVWCSLQRRKMSSHISSQLVVLCRGLPDATRQLNRQQADDLMHGDVRRQTPDARLRHNGPPYN